MNREKPFRPLAKEIPMQKQSYPPKQSAMIPLPADDLQFYRAAGKLTGKRALVTGGDSGIGRSVAIGFAKEGADVAIVYHSSDEDAQETKRIVESHGRKCLLLKGDVGSASECKRFVDETVRDLGGLNILVNNAAMQTSHEKFEDYTEKEIRQTFDTNILGYIFMAQAALKHLKSGDSIINSGSIVGIVGIPILIPYSATKGAIHSFTKSLAIQLGERNIRVNCVAPGPVWTPNIPATMPAEEVQNFGHEVALKRPGQPEEIAPAYVYFASDDGSFSTGAILEVTGGKLG